jgi:hypothetical protein
MLWHSTRMCCPFWLALYRTCRYAIPRKDARESEIDRLQTGHPSTFYEEIASTQQCITVGLTVYLYGKTLD